MKQVNYERSVEEPIFTLLQPNPTFLVVLTLVLLEGCSEGHFWFEEVCSSQCSPRFLKTESEISERNLYDSYLKGSFR